MLSTKPGGYYAERWRDYRRRFWALVFFFITYAPAQLFLVPLLSYKFSPRDAGSIIFITWAFGIAVSGIYLISWRCPRCHNHYFSKSLHHDPFAQKCLHCKLHKWALK
jgi:hypothetical protein